MRKLKFKIFRMWDVDDSGCINLQEMTNIVATMDDVEGVEQEPKVSWGCLYCIE